MFSDFVEGIIKLSILATPLLIQYLLYIPAKLIFKKVPKNKLYTICLIVNTILLFISKSAYLSSQNIEDMEAMDAFDGLIITIMWAPWYIGVLIACIAGNVKAKKNQKKE
ncbi:MAG: hypothetical protein K2G36_04080 [Ruminococcus sp.]|nr:hypothetical protein [Ruminococcus sp.]